MKQNWLIAALVFGLGVGLAPANEKNEVKEALRELQEFIGAWNGSGGPGAVWTESIEWGWRFKGDDAWLVLKVDKGKHVKEGELRYLPDDEKYQLTLTDAKGEKRVFVGEYKNNYLTLEHTDAKTGELHKIVMNTAAEGVRFLYRQERKPKGKTLFIRDYQVAATRKGESLGRTEKQNECVVSGGVGTMTVSFKGETFYVCCSGCRDEFNANPEKYVKEFKAKKR